MGLEVVCRGEGCSLGVCIEQVVADTQALNRTITAISAIPQITQLISQHSIKDSKHKT